MAPHGDNSPTSQSSPASLLSEDLVRHLENLDADELRAVIAYVKSQLPPAPTVRELIEEQPGEEIHKIEEDIGYTRVVKSEPCVEGCIDCPHGPYLYHVHVEPSLKDGEYTLKWEFLGHVTS